MLRWLTPTCVLCLLSVASPAEAAARHEPRDSVTTVPAGFLVIEHPAERRADAGEPLGNGQLGSPVWSISGRSWSFSPPVPLDRYRALIFATELRLGLPTGLLDALVAEESGYSVRAVSRRGAMGLAQLMPASARSLGVSDPFDPLSNVDAGGSTLR